MGDPLRSRCGRVALAAALGFAALLFSCSSGDDDGAAGANAAGSDNDPGTSGKNAAGAGASGSAGTRASSAGSHGGAGRAGSDASGGGSAGTAGSSQSGSSGGAQDAGGPQHFPISGSGGNQAPADSGLPTSFEGSCTTDADCELCTGPLGVGDPCCIGCPLVSSKEICAQIRAAMSMCGARKIGICPQVSCVAPGSPECSPEGKCVMGSGLEL